MTSKKVIAIETQETRIIKSTNEENDEKNRKGLFFRPALTFISFSSTCPGKPEGLFPFLVGTFALLRRRSSRLLQ